MRKPSESSACTICGGKTHFTHTSKIIKKYEAEYYRCEDCEYWFVLNPYWIKEAHSFGISSLDTGLVSRNLKFAISVSNLLRAFQFKFDVFVDWSGGNGLFTRLMREFGYNYLWTDKYSNNMFASGSEYISGSVGAVSLFEVLEHLEYPLETLQNIIEQTKCQMIIFSQTLHSNSESANWWYFMPTSGQHISFYSIKTLEVMAKELEMFLITFGDLFIFANQTVKFSWKFKLRMKLNKIYSTIYNLVMRKSLSNIDSKKLKISHEDESRQDSKI
jgi:hypothetical protein